MMNSLIENIKQRYSCRSFKLQKIDPRAKRELESYINTNRKGLFGEDIVIDIIEKSEESQKPMKLDYGIITNHSNYIVGKVKRDALSRMSYGFVVEKAVIKATSLGLNTCWIGYFGTEYFTEIGLNSDVEIPSIVIVGYAGKSTLSDKIIRLSISASKRKDWNKLFFHSNFSIPLERKDSALFESPLEMLRLAPSAGNTQPWRVVMEGNQKVFHFYKKPVSKKYEEMGLHDVDMGIALAHFDLTSEFYNLDGEWARLPDQNIVKNPEVEYMISYTIK